MNVINTIKKLSISSTITSISRRPVSDADSDSVSISDPDADPILPLPCHWRNSKWQTGSTVLTFCFGKFGVEKLFETFILNLLSLSVFAITYIYVYWMYI